MPNVMVYIPNRAFFKLSYYAEKNNLTLPKAVQDIVLKYLEQLENEKVVKTR